MVIVLYALTPCAAAGVYFFGWRTLPVIACSIAAAGFCEWLFVRTQGKPVTAAAFVTGALLALTLPPSIPLWMVAVGGFVAIAFGKMVFGGFGRNVFNPALVGRCFLYICFPVQMTGRFQLPPAGALKSLGAWAPPCDAVTAATPLGMWRDLARAYAYEPLDLFLGNVGGCIGETSAIAIGLGCVLLLTKRVANWRLMAAAALGAGLTSLVGHSLGAQRIPDPVFTFGSGGLLFAVVFMVTDPVSAASTKVGKWICGAAVGVLTVVLRSYSSFAGGVMFAILVVNMFTPSIDLLVGTVAGRRRAKESAK